MNRCTSLPHFKEVIVKNPIPIMPFLKQKSDNGDKKLDRRLKAIKRGFIPNTVKWCRKFRTNELKVSDEAIDGRWLFNPEELEKKDE